MLLRDFASGRKTLLGGLLLLSLGVGACEALFVLVAKSALAGAQWRTWSVPLLILAAIVTARSLGLIASARLELDAARGWIAARRTRVLALASSREIPAYRDPWRNALVTSLDGGLADMSLGLGAGFRCLAALAHAAALAPVLFLFSWKLAAAALALGAPAWLASRLRARALGDAASAWSRSRDDLATNLDAFADGLECETGNGRLSGAAARMLGGMERHAGRTYRWEAAKAFFPPSLEWFFFMALAALALFAGGAGGLGPEPSMGPAGLGLIPFGALLLLLYRPIREWARNHPVYALGERAYSGWLRLEADLEARPERRPRPVSPDGNLVFENVGFAYGASPDSGKVFAGLDLELDAHGFAWICGPNGAGKSTLLKLTAGIESPTSGRILAPAAGFRCAYLPQRAWIEPDYATWARAYHADHAAEWRTLDAILGLDPLLAKAGPGDRWEGLSGGERQRLCLARVFASNADYLLLDEPTTWMTAADRRQALGALLDFWRRPLAGGQRRGGAVVSHEPFLATICARTVRLEESPVGPAIRSDKAGLPA